MEKLWRTFYAVEKGDGWEDVYETYDVQTVIPDYRKMSALVPMLVEDPNWKCKESSYEGSPWCSRLPTMPNK